MRVRDGAPTWQALKREQLAAQGDRGEGGDVIRVGARFVPQDGVDHVEGRTVEGGVRVGDRTEQPQHRRQERGVEARARVLVRR